MAKDARLTVRIDHMLDAWLGTEGSRNGLDKAAFARMLLFRAMNGQADAAVKAVHPPIYADQAGLVEVIADRGLPAPQADIDAMVAARLAQAEARGIRQTAPAPPEEIDPAIAELGMRPHRVAPPPAFGMKSPRIQRSSSWAPSGAPY